MEFFSEEKKIEKKSFDKLFKRGVSLSWSIFFLSCFFLFWWWIDISYDKPGYGVKSDFFQKFFFFVNAKVFLRLFWEGYLINDLGAATNPQSLISLVCYLFTFLSFMAIIGCCGWLFIISYFTSVRPFHYIACLGIFPIIGPFLIFWWMAKLFVFSSERMLKGISRFDKDFSEEKFEESLMQQISENKQIGFRPINVAFTREHYEKLFGIRNKDILLRVYDKLNAMVS